MLGSRGVRWTLYDDPAGERLRPLTWLRPASGLLLGAETVEQRWRRLAGGDEVVVACRRILVPLAPGRISWEEAAASLRGDGPAGEARIWASDLLLADAGLLERLSDLPPDGIARVRGRLIAFHPGPRIRRTLEGAGARTAAGPGPAEEILDRIGSAGFPAREIEARVLSGLADLIGLQRELLAADLVRILAETDPMASCGDGFAYAPEHIRLGPGCRIDHGGVLDARAGPIVLGEGCTVSPHVWIRGPLFAAGGCSFVGGRIGGGSSIGPRCRVHGELEASVFLGFDNKAHEGFVGHSYLGEWVNLGAGTTTSDLKNNYSLVALEGESGKETTRLRKIGAFLGDHVKTRIGCLISCGTIVGVGSNLIGNPAVTSKRIADFRWGSGPEGVEYEINKFLQTAEIVYGRRAVAWTPGVEQALREIHAQARRSIGGS